jgi:hypothetical protein
LSCKFNHDDDDNNDLLLVRREIQDGLSNKRRVALAVFAGFPRNQRPLCHVHHYAAILPAAGTAYAGLAPVAIKASSAPSNPKFQKGEYERYAHWSASAIVIGNIETLSVFS